MLIALHKNATTTPAIRAALQQATGSDYELAREFKLIRETVRKWRKREGVQDASHTALRLQTTLDAAQEELVIYLRTQLLRNSPTTTVVAPRSASQQHLSR